MKWSVLCWTSGRYFLLKYWTDCLGKWSPPDCSKVRWQPGGLGRKTKLQILGENLEPTKTRGLIGVLLYHIVVGFFSVGFEGSWEKSTSYVLLWCCRSYILLRHFFLWTERQKTFLKIKIKNRKGGLNLTSLLNLAIKNAPTCFYLLITNVAFTEKISYLQTCY